MLDIRSLPAGGVLVAVLFAVAACSRGPVGNEHVRYRGTTLQVEGNDYPRESTPLPGVPGRLRVEVRDGQREAVVARLAAFGLEREPDGGGDAVRIKVPDGFEAQWAQALSMEPGVLATSGDDGAAAPAAGPAFVTTRPAVGGGVPVPDAPPSASDVVRLTRAMYAGLEANGGVPLVFSATGQPFVVHQQLADVVSEGCKRLPGSAPGEYECGVSLKVRSCTGDCDPSGEDALDDAKRIDIRWDGAAGRWVLG